MDIQIVIDLIGGAILSVLGWFARELWGAVKQLQADIHQIEVDLPKNYVTKTELNGHLTEIKELCRDIDDKLDRMNERKADKRGSD